LTEPLFLVKNIDEFRPVALLIDGGGQIAYFYEKEVRDANLLPFSAFNL
jgi:hypothetical protein